MALNSRVPILKVITANRNNKQFKKLLLAWIFLVLSGGYLNAGTCSGPCPEGSGCLTWSITYETDCTTGEIETFDSVHWFGGFNFLVQNEDTSPEWVGMNPVVLGCDAELCQ